MLLPSLAWVACTWRIIYAFHFGERSTCLRNDVICARLFWSLNVKWSELRNWIWLRKLLRFEIAWGSYLRCLAHQCTRRSKESRERNERNTIIKEFYTSSERNSKDYFILLSSAINFTLDRKCSHLFLKCKNNAFSSNTYTIVHIRVVYSR